MNVNGKRTAMSGLTDQIRHSVNNALTSTDCDFTAVLDDVLGTLEDPRMPPMLPIVDNIVGWFGMVGVLEALRRRAVDQSISTATKE